MKRHAVLIPISRQHHPMLLLSQLLKRNAPAYRGLPTTPEGKSAYAREQFKELLEGHFQKEERILFPYLKERVPSLEGMINQLLEEHQVLIQLFQQLFNNRSTADVNLLDSLGRKLEYHIRKEEREFFQEVQKRLSETEWQDLQALLYSE